MHTRGEPRRANSKSTKTEIEKKKFWAHQAKSFFFYFSILMRCPRCGRCCCCSQLLFVWWVVRSLSLCLAGACFTLAVCLPVLEASHTYTHTHAYSCTAQRIFVCFWLFMLRTLQTLHTHFRWYCCCCYCFTVVAVAVGVCICISLPFGVGQLSFFFASSVSLVSVHPLLLLPVVISILFDFLFLLYFEISPLFAVLVYSPRLQLCHLMIGSGNQPRSYNII